MPFRDILKKKEKVSEGHENIPPYEPEPEPQFTFIRSDTHTQEIISPPTFSSAASSDPPSLAEEEMPEGKEGRASRWFGRPRTASSASNTSHGSDKSAKKPSTGHKRLSQRFVSCPKRYSSICGAA